MPSFSKSQSMNIDRLFNTTVDTTVTINDGNNTVNVVNHVQPGELVDLTDSLLDHVFSADSLNVQPPLEAVRSVNGKRKAGGSDLHVVKKKKPAEKKKKAKPDDLQLAMLGSSLVNKSK